MKECIFFKKQQSVTEINLELECLQEKEVWNAPKFFIVLTPVYYSKELVILESIIPNN